MMTGHVFKDVVIMVPDNVTGGWTDRWTDGRTLFEEVKMSVDRGTCHFIKFKHMDT